MNKFFRHVVVVFLGIAVHSPFAHADILFIDFNFSDKEIKAAREAASERGENLVVIPDLSDEIRHQLRVLEDKVLPLREKIKAKDKEIAAAKERVNSVSGEGVAVLAELESARAQWVKKMGGSEREYEALREKNVNYKDFSGDLEVVLAKLNLNQRTLSSMVISGHYTDNYFGEAGVLQLPKIASFLKANPNVSADLGFVYLWDCYSATVGEVQTWRQIFPKINIVGFDDRSTSQKNPYNMSFLKDAMIKERSLVEAKDIQTLDQLFKSISGMGNPAKLAGAACVGDTYYSTGHGTHLLSDRSVLCNPARVAELKRKKTQFDLFYAASTPGFEDVPSDTAQGPVRAFYSLAKQMKSCPEVAGITAMGSKSVNLVFFRNLQTNFQIKYADELNRLARGLSRKGIALGVPNFASGSIRRSEVMHFAAALKQEASRLSDRDADSQFISKFSSKVQALLVNFNCVPSLWIEPVSDASKLETPVESCF